MLVSGGLPQVGGQPVGEIVGGEDGIIVPMFQVGLDCLGGSQPFFGEDVFIPGDTGNILDNCLAQDGSKLKHSISP